MGTGIAIRRIPTGSTGAADRLTETTLRWEQTA